LFKPTEMIDVSAGLIRFKGRVITDMHRYGPLSFTDVLVKSSNVGAIKIGSRVGAEQMGLYVRRFGFGHQTSRDFPGESPGIVWSNLNDSALASVSMGYQIGVTPLQMAAAVSSVANGGLYVEPRAVRAMYRDGRRYQLPPRVVRRTISPDTAATLTTIMEEVVTDGTAKRAQIPGYTIAGKTGTAQKLINGRYSQTINITSFAGVFPMDEPRYVVVVMLDEPKATPETFGFTTAGWNVAPVVSRTISRIAPMLGVQPNMNREPDMSEVMPFVHETKE
jgi:cell division protein FtsI (penicillin-binding protein 3)